MSQDDSDDKTKFISFQPQPVKPTQEVKKTVSETAPSSGAESKDDSLFHLLKIVQNLTYHYKAIFKELGICASSFKQTKDHLSLINEYLNEFRTLTGQLESMVTTMIVAAKKNKSEGT